MGGSIRLLVGVVSLSGASWCSSLLTNGSFEAPIAPDSFYTVFPIGSTAITGWTVVGASPGNVAVVGGSIVVGGITYAAAGGAQSVDLSGNFDDGASRGLTQTVILSPGTYTLAFDVGNYSAPNGSGSPFPSAIELLIDGSAAGSFANSDNTTGRVNWKAFSYTFEAFGSTSIRLQSSTLAGSDNYTGLDNVSLDLAVPEPGTLSGLAGGAFLLALRCRRRRALRARFPA